MLHRCSFIFVASKVCAKTVEIVQRVVLKKLMLFNSDIYISLTLGSFH